MLPLTLTAHIELWSGWEDLNFRLPVSKTGALARLSYTLKFARADLRTRTSELHLPMSRLPHPAGCQLWLWLVHSANPRDDWCLRLDSNQRSAD